MYELGFYIPEQAILHSHRREPPNLTSLQNSSDTFDKSTSTSCHLSYPQGTSPKAKPFLLVYIGLDVVNNSA
jgi:hypothetical protein